MVLKSQDELMNAIIQLGTKQSSLPSDLDKELHSPVTPEERAEAEGEAEGEFKTLLNDLDMTEGEWAEWQVAPLASLSSVLFTRKPALHVSAPLFLLDALFLSWLANALCLHLLVDLFQSTGLANRRWALALSLSLRSLTQSGNGRWT